MCFTHCYNGAVNFDLMLGDQTLLGSNSYPLVAYWNSHVHLTGIYTHFKCSLSIKNQSFKIHLKSLYLFQKTLHDVFCLILIMLLSFQN